MTIKILVLASNPSGTEPLKVNDEIRSIKESHERSPKREEFTILPEPAVRIKASTRNKMPSPRGSPEGEPLISTWVRSIYI